MEAFILHGMPLDAPKLQLLDELSSSHLPLLKLSME